MCKNTNDIHKLQATFKQCLNSISPGYLFFIKL